LRGHAGKIDGLPICMIGDRFDETTIYRAVRRLATD
jgi:hypothetical protein